MQRYSKASILIFVIMLFLFSPIPVFAENDGDAVYRDGVVFNIDDHAAIFYWGVDGVTKCVIQARGYGYTVDADNWNSFLDGHQYLYACYNPSYQPASSILNTAWALKYNNTHNNYCVGGQLEYINQ